MRDDRALFVGVTENACFVGATIVSSGQRCCEFAESRANIPSFYCRTCDARPYGRTIVVFSTVCGRVSDPPQQWIGDVVLIIREISCIVHVEKGS